MAYKYAYAGPPFNFLGHFSETQKNAFKKWITNRSANFKGIQLINQIRAQQLRKTAGLLEAYYTNAPHPGADKALAPTFVKETWQPGTDGHFAYPVVGDQPIMATVYKVKSRFKEQLQRDDEGVFFMNHVRSQIESHEDAAQYANDAVNTNVSDHITALLAAIDGLFAKPQFDSVLVKDQSQTYKGQPYFRVNPFDAPTQWELELQNHSNADTPINIKEQEAAGS